MSDDSENDGVIVDNKENDLYYRKYKLLLEECSQLQRSNEILVFRYFVSSYMLSRHIFMNKFVPEYRKLIKLPKGD